ncbi:hypothetical protein ACP4OV_024390 [Aristida adscensionis]
MARLEFTSRAENLGQSPPEQPLDSSLVEMNWDKVAQSGGASANREEKLSELRIVDMKIASLDRAVGKGSRIRLLPELSFDDKAAVPRLALPLLTPPEKYICQASPSKGCASRRWRRVRRQSHNNPLQLSIDFLVLATGYSLGIIGLGVSGNRDRKRVRVKEFSSEGTRRKTHRNAIRHKGDDYTVETHSIASDAGDAFSNNRRATMSMSYDGDRSEDRQSEEVQSAYKRDSEVDEEMVRKNFNLGRAEEQNDENEWSWVPQDGDPLAESISSLQATQEVLESEVHVLSELSKRFDAEESSSSNKDDVIFLPDAEVDIFKINDKMEHLEQKLKEASNTIREKDLRLSKLQVLVNTAHSPTLEEATNIDQLEMELERQLQDKIQAEIACLVMVKARQNWQVRAEDQIALEEHKLSSGDITKMMLKLRETENKIVMLKEQVDKLEVHEKELFGTTEVLKVQSRTFKVSLFGLLQLIMLCLSLKIFFARVSVPFGDVVPT